eukprot:365603-Chlamydomonas_euryale.AAC.13
MAAQVAHHLAAARDVAATRAKGLGERAHHDVNVRRWHAPLLRAAAARAAQRTNRVRLVEVNVRTVLLAHSHDVAQVAGLALHGVDALNNDDDLLPRPVRPRLPVHNRATQHAVQVARVVVAEHLDLGAAAARTHHDARVIELVAHNQRTLLRKHGNHGAVGSVAHANHDGILLAKELRHLTFQLHVHIGGATVGARSARADHAQPSERLLHTRRAVLVRCRKAEVVVAAQVEAALAAAGEVHAAGARLGKATAAWGGHVGDCRAFSSMISSRRDGNTDKGAEAA